MTKLCSAILKSNVQCKNKAKYGCYCGIHKKHLPKFNERDVIESKNTIHDVNMSKYTLNKQQIIELFMKNVKCKEITVNKKHHGGEGHWLETQMGIKHNSRNESDILGFEMKKSSRKITFGDFSASEYVFSTQRTMLNEMNGWNDTHTMKRVDFIKTFGT
jgi:hypothetical protein